MQSRVELYKSTFKVLSNSQLQPSFKSFEKRPTHNKIDWDIRPINQENYTLRKYEPKKLLGKNKVDLFTV